MCGQAARRVFFLFFTMLSSSSATCGGVQSLTALSGATLTAFTEEVDDKCWVLVLAYQRFNGENAALVSGTLPTSPFGYSHRFVSTLGVQNSDVIDTRWFCNTTAHPRQIHFTNNESSVIQMIVTDVGKQYTGTFLESYLDAMKWKSVLMPDHTGTLPRVSASTILRGHTHPTYYPIYSSNPTRFWAIRGDDRRWECDDSGGGNSIHQIWILLASPPLPPAPPSFPPPSSPVDGALLELTGTAPRIVFGPEMSPVCSLSLNTAAGRLVSTCDLMTPSDGRRLDVVEEGNALAELKALKAEYKTLEVEVAELRRIVNELVKAQA